VDEEEGKNSVNGEEDSPIKEEEEMLDIAEHCFIKIAEIMIEQNKTVRGVFAKYSIPE
jgi:hypothetical protein